MDIFAKYQKKDPFYFEENLTAHEKNVMHNTRQFADQVLRPNVLEAFRHEKWDPAILSAMGKYGIIGAGIDQCYGGTNENAVAYGLIARELERVDSGYRTIFSVCSSLVARAISLFGSDAQKEKYLRKLAEGKLTVSFALTEPHHGSNPDGMETRAIKNGTKYTLNGHKRWIGLSPYADIFIVWARDQDHHIRGFIVERTTSGVETPVIQGKCSLRAAPSGEIILRQVEITENDCLPLAVGLKATFQCLNAARFTIAWGAIGAAEDCFDHALHYTLEREQFGKPLAHNQLIQKKLVDMHTEIQLGLLACLQMSRLVEAKKASPELISLLKRNSAHKALQIARAARDLLGGNGILDEYHVMRHVVNLEAVNTYEGTEDIHTLILGKALTGLMAF